LKYVIDFLLGEALNFWVLRIFDMEMLLKPVLAIITEGINMECK